MTTEETTAAFEAKRVPLWCPWCGKRHADLGEFRTLQHRTHLCVNDMYGIGCARLWRLEEVVFGAYDDADGGGNAKHIAVLSEIFDSHRTDWTVDAALAFGAALRSLRADDELTRVAEQIEEQREKLLSQQKNTDDYERSITELERLQRQIGYAVMRSMRRVEQCLQP